MLQYNSEANSQDCVSEILDLCSTTLNVYTIKQITREFNFALDMYFSWAFDADGQHKWDDFNQSAPPIDNQDIVSGTNRYKLSDFAMKIQGITKLELLDLDGEPVKIEPETMDDLKHNKESFDDKYVNADSGIPDKYIILGDYIYFDKKPNWDKTAGLLVYVDRPASYMVVGDTTKVPGVMPLHIKHVCELTAIPYKLKNGLMSNSEAKQLERLIRDRVQTDFKNSTENIRNIMTPAQQDNR